MSNPDTLQQTHEQNPSEAAREVLLHARNILARALETVGRTDEDPINVFPAPGPVRQGSGHMPLTSEQEQSLVAVASELGFGKQEDVNLSEQGVHGATVIMEGGFFHKVQAEAQGFSDDDAAQPAQVIYTASGTRILSNTEINRAKTMFGPDTFGSASQVTELEMAELVARNMPGFIPHTTPRILSAAYDPATYAFTMDADESPQFIEIGKFGDAPVIIMRIDQASYPDKEPTQPQGADLLGIIDAFTRADGGGTSALMTYTSRTYSPSRQVAAALASMNLRRGVGVATYGTRRLNWARGTDSATPADLKQLPGELHVMAEQTAKLGATLDLHQAELRSSDGADALPTVDLPPSDSKELRGFHRAQHIITFIGQWIRKHW